MNRRAIIAGQKLGFVEMKPTGHWGLTREGMEFLDVLNVMQELDDRPGAEANQAGQALRSDARTGDDGRRAPRTREAS